jgi:hypothetical protein
VDPWRRLVRKIQVNERPVELAAELRRMRTYTDPERKGYLSPMERYQPIDSLPRDLDGVFLIGHPDSTPAMKDLCQRVGFVVDGERLTYDGTTISLNDGSALAMVDLGQGKRCAIGLGTVILEPNIGRARLALTDGYGRFLRGVTEPKSTGHLTLR